MTPREKHAGVVFVMIGPGGAGKNAIMKAIMAVFPAVRQLATATTRPMRADERQGREHLFVSETRFRAMIQNDELLEHQEVTPGKYYGIPRQTVEESLAAGAALIADIEVLGAMRLAAAYPDNVVQIFITVPGATSPSNCRCWKNGCAGEPMRRPISTNGWSARGHLNCLIKVAATMSW